MAITIERLMDQWRAQEKPIKFWRFAANKVSQLDDRVRELEAWINKNRPSHYYCEDEWYSCPKHPEGSANDCKGDECDCGADKKNAEIDKLLNPPESGEK